MITACNEFELSLQWRLHYKLVFAWWRLKWQKRPKCLWLDAINLQLVWGVGGITNEASLQWIRSCKRCANCGQFGRFFLQLRRRLCFVQAISSSFASQIIIECCAGIKLGTITSAREQFKEELADRQQKATIQVHLNTRRIRNNLLGGQFNHKQLVWWGMFAREDKRSACSKIKHKHTLDAGYFVSLVISFCI